MIFLPVFTLRICDEIPCTRQPYCIYGTYDSVQTGDDKGLYIDQFDETSPIGNCGKKKHFNKTVVP